MSSLLDPVVSLHFDVIIDGCPIGSFTECSGLGAEYAVKDHEEGGQNGALVKLLGKLKFPNITLKRALDAESTPISVWFDTIRLNPLRTTAQIVASTPDGIPLRVWHIFDVVPVKWTGPQFSSTGNSIATETLELAHHGFY
jgi:phage tail-like protein